MGHQVRLSMIHELYRLEREARPEAGLTVAQSVSG